MIAAMAIGSAPAARGAVVWPASGPKPRVAPTASHLQAVIDVMKKDGAKVILREPWQAPDAADFVAAQTGAKVIEMAQFPIPARAARTSSATSSASATVS